MSRSFRVMFVYESQSLREIQKSMLERFLGQFILTETSDQFERIIINTSAVRQSLTSAMIVRITVARQTIRSGWIIRLFVTQF